MLALLAAMLGVFVARDLLLFYVFFELTLIPMFFIIGIWGGPERRFAAGKFFLFTFAGSVFTLAAVDLSSACRPDRGIDESFDIDDVVRFAQTQPDAPPQRFWVAAGPARRVRGEGAAVPGPHLAAAGPHRSADGRLGHPRRRAAEARHLRPAPPCRPDRAWLSSRRLRPEPPFPRLVQCLGVLCVIGIIYGALVAWVQQDIKKLVAYCSVSPPGLLRAGLVALNTIGIQGSVLYMINHGLSTGALFL